MAVKVGTTGALPTPTGDAVYYGQGISYPLALNSQGQLALSTGVDCVQDALSSILLTMLGERPALIQYGANIGLMEPILADSLEIEFKSQVALYEPRVLTINSFNAYMPVQGELHVDITYTLVGNNIKGNLSVVI